MTPSQAQQMLTKLPPEWEPLVRRALVGAWADGFGCGIARLPSRNPFVPEQPESPKGKRR